MPVSLENRVAAAIASVRATLAELPADKVAGVDATLALDFGEHFQYQQLQAQSHAAGVLSTDEAQVIYAALGEHGSAGNGGWSEGTDTATKYAVTRIIGMLLGSRISARQRLSAAS